MASFPSKTGVFLIGFAIDAIFTLKLLNKYTFQI